MAIKIQGTTIINDETAYIDLAGSTAVKVPVGSAGERPAGVAGQIRYNSTDGIFEGYDGTEWGPLAEAGEAGDSAAVADTAPSSPQSGDLWWDSSTGTLKIYYDDGTSQQWVDASPTLQSQFTNPDTNFINQPTGISPAQNDVVTNTTFTLTSSAYDDLLDNIHTSSDWQIASDSGFNTIVLESLNDGSNLTSFEVTGGLENDGTFYWRVRYRDDIGTVSEFSTPIEFNLETPPPELGDSYCGGFYIGTTCANSTEYYLIVAPNATGCAQCLWKTTRTATAGTSSTTDGFSNTYGPLDNADHPAGNWTATRTINGFSDWYLPARDELNVLYVNDGGSTNTTLPSGEGFAAGNYWSSTEGSATGACLQYFLNGLQGIGFTKATSFRVRAVRREPI